MRDLLVGVPLLVLVLVVMTGSAEAAGNLLFFSILCTLGVGGIFWGLMAWILGTITVLVLDQLMQLLGGPRLLASVQGAVNGLPPSVLTGYVERRRQMGGDDDHIRADLLRGGWSPADVEAALAVVERGDDRC